MTSDSILDWELVNRLPKIQTEAEFPELMSEHFVGFPPSGGTRNYAHGGNDSFRINFTLVSCDNRYELVLEQNSFGYHVKGP